MAIIRGKTIALLYEFWLKSSPNIDIIRQIALNTGKQMPKRASDNAKMARMIKRGKTVDHPRQEQMSEFKYGYYPL